MFHLIVMVYLLMDNYILYNIKWNVIKSQYNYEFEILMR